MSGGSSAARTARLRVVVTDQNGRPVAAHGLGPWLRRVAPARARGTVAVAIVPDRTMQAWNREYRGKDSPTDVLSFPAAAPEPRRKRPARRAPQQLEHLGDLAIALGVARRQAREHGHSLAVELRVLALHGLLHLLGYDHEVDQGRMKRVEDRLRRRGGLPAGLTARASRRPAHR
jgi:probable rRNA maturation factor